MVWYVIALWPLVGILCASLLTGWRGHNRDIYDVILGGIAGWIMVIVVIIVLAEDSEAFRRLLNYEIGKKED